MKILTLCLSILLFSCNNKEAIPPTFTENTEALKFNYAVDLERAKQLRDSNGMLSHDCDGMIWNGKYASSKGVSKVKIEKMERENGRYGRRVEPCWTEEDGNLGADTTWSRDMAICGLFPYAWKKEKLDLLVRHKDYGVDNLWKMGDPLDDGRTLYTPGIIGLLYSMIFALGGDDNKLRHTPDVYPKGLDDYEAHLQICKIWLRGEIDEKLESKSLFSVSAKMYARIEEHFEREPANPFYSFLWAKYETGDFAHVVALLLDLSRPMGSYVRCENEERCFLAERIFVSSLVLEYLE